MQQAQQRDVPTTTASPSENPSTPAWGDDPSTEPPPLTLTSWLTESSSADPTAASPAAVDVQVAGHLTSDSGDMKLTN